MIATSLSSPVPLYSNNYSEQLASLPAVKLGPVTCPWTVGMTLFLDPYDLTRYTADQTVGRQNHRLEDALLSEVEVGNGLRI